MAGMTTTGNSSLSNYDGRIVEIHVTGVCRQDVMRMSDYTVKVTHNRMVQAMQSINSLGGKVVGVKVTPSSNSSESSEG